MSQITQMALTLKYLPSLRSSQANYCYDTSTCVEGGQTQQAMKNRCEVCGISKSEYDIFGCNGWRVGEDSMFSRCADCCTGKASSYIATAGVKGNVRLDEERKKARGERQQQTACSL